ncbi:hypothetical protein F5Y16DRAFT_204770 [Xylariaceae sp. FL0255]|nr:hypothetical protein F5Y16DRAFT_204770 [Xylariaceae sp. FL0255]
MPAAQADTPSRGKSHDKWAKTYLYLTIASIFVIASIGTWIFLGTTAQEPPPPPLPKTLVFNARLTPYSVLGVAPSATDAEIRRAYRVESRRHHPDKQRNNAIGLEGGREGGEEEEEEASLKYGHVQQAYDLLNSPARCMVDYRLSIARNSIEEERHAYRAYKKCRARWDEMAARRRDAKRAAAERERQEQMADEREEREKRRARAEAEDGEVFRSPWVSDKALSTVVVGTVVYWAAYSSELFKRLCRWLGVIESEGVSGI